MICTEGGCAVLCARFCAADGERVHVGISHRSQSFFQLGTESSEILIVRRTVAAGIVFLLKSC